MESRIMDSRMLNVFHEDPFEGNYVKYETDPSFWTTNEDLQLTDTLNGILPIAPTDESLLSQNEAQVQLQNSKNLLIYNDFVDQQLSDDANVVNGQVYEQQRQLSAIIDSDEYEDDNVAVIRIKADDDELSQCSNSTFRTRTDSSSIGDYESHSSDYDDDIDCATNKSLLTTEPLVKQNGQKSRTLSTNTLCSDGDALGLNIDVNNFDLADFITKDDFASNAAAAVSPSKQHTAAAKSNKQRTNIAAKKTVTPLPKPVVISSKSRDSDYDSDSIIDVETVDVIDVDESEWMARQSVEPAVAADDLCYVDNVKADPSWCPKQQGKRIVAAEHKTAPASSQMTSKTAVPSPVPSQAAAAVATASTTKPKASKNICLVPNKKQCDFLKRKVGTKTAGIIPTTPSKSKLSAKKTQEATKSTPGKQKNLTKTSPPVSTTGLGLGGKNLALIKHECDAANVTLIPTAATPAPKRKLNLDEYKQRRCGAVVSAKQSPSSSPVPSKQVKLETGKAIPPTPLPKSQKSPQKAVISSIVNSLKSPVPQAAVATDPITAAKNKVLRMLEMKRAQQLKIIESRESAKVPRVTKLPTLKDIVKDTYCMETEPEAETTPTKIAASRKLHADYEEIIIVSTGCNTDITIPPHQASDALRDNRTTTPSTRSLLKSSMLLYNISNGSEAGKDMTNSLIASIQSEVVKQTNCAALTINSATTASAGTITIDKNAQHGEDMVIMHLAKNRVRKRMVTIGTQTELQPEFPLLTLPATRQSRERTRRSYRKRRSDDTASDDSSCRTSSASTCSSIASYRSRSNSNSTERLRHSDATAACGSSIGGGGYSSRSTRRHRSSVSSSSYSEAGKYARQQRQRRTSYNKRRSKNQTRDTCSTSGSEYSDRERSRSPQRRSRSRSSSNTRFGNNNNNRRGFVDRNVSQPAVEERRIVYVGRIETDTSKEQLRRKFLPYGSIKQITIHYKENGMKYGFVTFERAQDAFTAIDTSARDAQINMYDISFGGRRAFCRASYADLDNAGINNYHSYVFPKAAPAPPPQEDSFEALLLKVKAKLNAGKPATVQTTPADTQPDTPTPAAAAAATLDGDNKNNNMSSSKI